MTSKAFFEEIISIDKQMEDFQTKIDNANDDDKEVIDYNPLNDDKEISKWKKEIKTLKKQKKQFIFGVDILSEISLGEKYLLTQILKKYKKITCISGEHISDCFALSEADIGLT